MLCVFLILTFRDNYEQTKYIEFSKRCKLWVIS